jgi:hypothetical protein
MYKGRSRARRPVSGGCRVLTLVAWATEGGIRCPSIIRFPSFAHTGDNKITHEFTTVMDILPTIVRPKKSDLSQY